MRLPGKLDIVPYWERKDEGTSGWYGVMTRAVLPENTRETQTSNYIGVFFVFLGKWISFSEKLQQIYRGLPPHKRNRIIDTLDGKSSNFQLQKFEPAIKLASAHSNTVMPQVSRDLVKSIFTVQELSWCLRWASDDYDLFVRARFSTRIPSTNRISKIPGKFRYWIKPIGIQHLSGRASLA